MNAEQIAALIERVEAAEGPSRHLDTQIAIILDPDAQHIVGHEPGPFPREPIYGPRSTFWEWACDETIEPPVFMSVPAYTASIDAALALLPEGWRVQKLGEQQEYDNEGPYQDEWSARLHFPDPPMRSNMVWGKGSSAALALCAACLRALLEQER